MNPLISICIPTYQRSNLVQQAIESCLHQTYSEIEIVICDDSPNQLTEQVVQAFNQPEKIRYYRNQPSLKQASNVNRLFDLALGDRLVLLHDDDLLHPHAVAALAHCWNLHPNLTAAFGKQHLIDVSGNILPSSEQLNESYYRTDRYAGYQESSLWSALTAQFPNDGYMINTKAAQKVRYCDRPEVGDACDFEFGLRLAAQCDGFFFLNEYTMMYRLTGVSISQGNNYTNLTYQIIRSLTLPEALEPLRQSCLKRYAAPAINRYLALGERKAALEIFVSQAYSWSQRFSYFGLFQALLLVCPEQWGLEILKLIKTIKQSRRLNIRVL